MTTPFLVLVPIKLHFLVSLATHVLPEMELHGADLAVWDLEVSEEGGGPEDDQIYRTV